MPNHKKSLHKFVPLALMLSGQGFASNRYPFSIQYSNKVSGKSLVYINPVKKPEIPSLSTPQTQAKSPFSAFTNQALARIDSAKVYAKSDTIEFLNSNDLLSVNTSTTSIISGHTQKTYSDDWQWNTRLTKNPLTVGANVNSRVNSKCVNGATYGGQAMNQMIWGFDNSLQLNYLCRASAVSKTLTIISNLNANNILAKCQALHKACDKKNLPVELEKFEVE